jgi:hypothetical protein
LIIKSVRDVRIRLTRERWYHITKRHIELKKHASKVLLTVQDPDFIVRGKVGELIAVRYFRLKPSYLMVAYRETNEEDGFIITAHFISNISQIMKREIVWQKS